MKRSQRQRLSSGSKRMAARAVLVRGLLVVIPLLIMALTIMGYGIKRYKKDYYGNALRACDILAAELSDQSDTMPASVVMDAYVPEALDKVADELNIYIYLFNTDGQCVTVTSNTAQQPAEVSLNNEMLFAMENDGVYLTDEAAGKFNRRIAEPMLCRGVTVSLTLDGETVTYYMFSCSATRPLNAYTEDVVAFTTLIFVGLLGVCIIFILVVTLSKARRQEQFLCILRQYAQGDFSQQLDPEQYVGTDLGETAQLIQEISSQTQRAEASSRQFVSNVSHELRTPMTIIRGYVEGILDGTVPKNRRMEYLSIVSQEIQRLQMLVNSMLNLTKFDAGTIQLNYRVFALNDMAFRTMMMFSSRLEKRQIEVEGLDSETMRVCADPDLIGQVIYNLVENAVKFVNDRGTISFTFRTEEKEWIFAIRNTGSGISKEELPKIFERFYKSDASRSKDKTGLGLGLDITRRIIHLHHAHISVRSEENAYTEFEVRLPRVEPPEVKQDS